jgi:hypothetical protein
MKKWGNYNSLCDICPYVTGNFSTCFISSIIKIEKSQFNKQKSTVCESEYVSTVWKNNVLTSWKTQFVRVLALTIVLEQYDQDTKGQQLSFVMVLVSGPQL